MPTRILHCTCSYVSALTGGRTDLTSLQYLTLPAASSCSRALTHSLARSSESDTLESSAGGSMCNGIAEA